MNRKKQLRNCFCIVLLQTAGLGNIQVDLGVHMALIWDQPLSSCSNVSFINVSLACHPLRQTPSFTPRRAVSTWLRPQTLIRALSTCARSVAPVSARGGY